MTGERDELQARIARLRELADVLDDPETADRLRAHIELLERQLQKAK